MDQAEQQREVDRNYDFFQRALAVSSADPDIPARSRDRPAIVRRGGAPRHRRDDERDHAAYRPESRALFLQQAADETARGEAQVSRYLVRIGLVAATDDGGAPGGFPFVFDEIEAFELTEGFSLDALLGMDVLSRCGFPMTRAGVCRLTFGSGAR